MGEKMEEIFWLLLFFSLNKFFIHNIIHKKYFESVLQYKLVHKSFP